MVSLLVEKMQLLVLNKVLMMMMMSVGRCRVLMAGLLRGRTVDT